MWVSPGAGCSESMMPRCKWGAAAIQVRGQQLGLLNSQPNPTLFSSPIFPCLNPHLRGVEEMSGRALGRDGRQLCGDCLQHQLWLGMAPMVALGLGTGWESKWEGEEEFLV